ncbi:MAG: polymorphic toxin type 15 domain-containing protein [Proteobacteria bacterium]|nr:polymorphic toxin type 15 domain-containing protein [Pseudomonadota bacterium]
MSTAPSINKTPVGAATPPLPYPVFQDLSNSIGIVPSVRFNGDPAYVLDQTTQPSCKGDDPGSVGGVKSGTVNGEVKPIQGSCSVRAGGHWVIRQGDPCTMNSGNCPGIYTTTQVPSAMTAAGSTSDPSDMNPPIESETEEEKGFFDTFKDYISTAGQYYKDNISGPLHEFSGDAMDKGAKISLAGGGIMATGLGVGAMGVGIPVTAPVAVPVAAGMEVVGGATSTVGGGVGLVGMVTDFIATGLDATADFVTEGKSPELQPIALGLGERIVEKKFEKLTGRVFDKLLDYVPKSIKDKIKGFIPSDKKSDKTPDKKPETNKPPGGVKIIPRNNEVKCFKIGDSLKKNWKGTQEELEKEFDRQLEGQAKGLSDMTVAEYLEGREKFKDIRRGSSSEQAKARMQYESSLQKTFTQELKDKGILGQEAENQAKQLAKDRMSTLNALHNPDMVAGGKNEIHDFGNTNVNKSLGSQWKYKDRLAELDKQANEIPESERKNTKLKTELNRCK